MTDNIEPWVQALAEALSEYVDSTGSWIDQFIQIIEKHQQPSVPVSKWVDIKDNLPIDGKRYLVCYLPQSHGRGKQKRQKIYLAWWASGKWRDIDRKKTALSERVTHWMPLPKPPEGQAEDMKHTYDCSKHDMNSSGEFACTCRASNGSELVYCPEIATEKMLLAGVKAGQHFDVTPLAVGFIWAAMVSTSDEKEQP